MGPRRLLWQVYPFFVLTLVTAVLAVLWQATAAWRRFYENEVAADLLARAQILETRMGPSLLGAPAELDLLCKRLGEQTQTRLTVMDPAGRVLGDSDHDPQTMDNHATRPEMAAALAGETGRSMRYSDTLRRHMLYVAVPVRRDGALVAVVRTSLPLRAIDAALRAGYGSMAAGVLIVLGLGAGASFLLVGTLTRPLADMRLAADRFARGDLAARVPEPRSAELGALARALNGMAVQLDTRLREIVRQRNEQEAVLSSMVEGVVAVDDAERVLDLNQAATRLLGVEAASARGRSVQEVVRNTELQHLVAGILAEAPGPAETAFVLHGDEDRFIQAHGAVLRDPAGRRIGAVVVLNDVTRLKRLEQVRRDFVANVSHELKTPITALKGCLETLADGAVSDPDQERRFVDIMVRHADRLEAIVEDLLSLSRLEHEEERGRVPLEPAAVQPVLLAAAQTCAGRAAEKRIEVRVECPDDLRAAVNAPLLEQAVVNLIDNAVKNSEPGTAVRVSARLVEGRATIRVADQGCGIEKRHLSRIFERFYRVDQARSRTLGGTGLGLAIVKHIALVHGGQVGVESTPGAGSTFSIALPALPPAG
jgi:two-component system phosphate regulon sensor histidine kinase PhoR